MSTDSQPLPSAAQSLIDRFKSRQATVGIIGLGYVGLPLAVVFAKAGYRVVGIDSSREKIEAIRRGESYLLDVPSADLAECIRSGQLSVSVSYQALAGADGVSICVPTPLRKTGDPDLSFIISTVESLRDYLRPEMVVVLESTTYPGTTREIVLTELESTGLRVGEAIFLAFSPERVDPGRKDWTTVNTPKIIGGITSACTQVAAEFYGQAIQPIVKVSSTEVAEMAKLLENTFRAVNIAMANEMALMCERLGIDVWEVIEAAATKPFGFMKFKPGPGLGGHCIPVDPIYLSWKLKTVKYNARFIDLASEINTAMPRYVVGRVQNLLNEQGKPLHGARLLVMGAAYKADVADTRESPALDVIGLLLEQGGEVEYFDPHVPSIEHEGWNMRSVADVENAARGADCVIILTDHSDVDYAGIADSAPLIFDTRNVVADTIGERPNVVKM